MLSIFTKPNPRKDPLYQITLSSGSENIEAVPNKVPSGLVLRIPLMMIRGDKVRQATVRHFLSDEQIRQFAEVANVVKTVSVIKEVVVGDPAANRDKFCRNGHRLISENVIHWPNGTEDCRVCYMEWKAKKGGK